MDLRTAGPAAAERTAPVPRAAVAAYPGDERLRQVIREELTDVLAASMAQEAKPAPLAARNEAVDRAAIERRRQEVEARLQYHASVGTISPSDMQALQADIAQLDEPARTEMLGELIKALNTGRLEGRL